MDAFKKRLLQVQADLKAPKGQYNSFGKYKYRSCEDILEAAKPVLLKHGVIITISDSIIAVSDRVYVQATATAQDAETGESLSVTAFAREPETKKGMDDSQVTGTASSYARKYALNGLLLIDDTKDADTDEHAQQTANAQQQPQKAQKQPQKAEPPAPEITCTKCGKPVQAFKRFTAQEIANRAKESYGSVMCYKCASEMKVYADAGKQ